MLTMMEYESITNVSIDLAWHKGIKNTGEDATVYAPQSGPNGLIKCEVTRDEQPRL